MNPSSAFARVFVDELVRCGVREFVLSPGSRSAPLALVLAVDSRVRLHVRHDERSAGFLAVGLAKVSARPVAVVCTSGTAVASLHPAVLEASHARVPLLALTADRPPELRATGSNQTTDQVGIYGTAPRWAYDVGVPEKRVGAVAYWRSVAARACAVATAVGDAGPVHLNLPFREPLVSDADPSWPEPFDGRPDGRPWLAVDQEPPAVTVLRDAPERGAVLVGEGCAERDAAARLAAALGWPLLSEPTGDARTGDNAVGTFPLLLADQDFAAAHPPDLVVTVGTPGLSRSVLAWLRTAGEQIVVDPSHAFTDPTRTASRVLAAVPVAAKRRAATSWLRSWLAADEAAREAVDTVLDETEELSEPKTARELVATLPGDALLFVGSSRPVRDVEAYAVPRDGVHVLGNRGLAGIDGSASSAIGAALAHQRDGGGHAYALLGDLAALHDVNGFAVPEGDDRPNLTFVVVDNDGGGIFSLLEQDGEPGAERVFGTPHGLDLAMVLAAYGVPVTEVAKASDLRTALVPSAGMRAVLVRTDRVESAALHRRLQDAVHRSLSR